MNNKLKIFLLQFFINCITYNIACQIWPAFYKMDKELTFLQVLCDIKFWVWAFITSAISDSITKKIYNV